MSKETPSAESQLYRVTVTREYIISAETALQARAMCEGYSEAFDSRPISSSVETYDEPVTIDGE